MPQNILQAKRFPDARLTCFFSYCRPLSSPRYHPILLLISINLTSNIKTKLFIPAFFQTTPCPLSPTTSLDAPPTTLNNLLELPLLLPPLLLTLIPMLLLALLLLLLIPLPLSTFLHLPGQHKTPLCPRILP